jgi:hypothetical protein
VVRERITTPSSHASHTVYFMMAEGLLRGIATGVKDREKRTKGKRGERERLGMEDLKSEKREI